MAQLFFKLNYQTCINLIYKFSFNAAARMKCRACCRNPHNYGDKVPLEWATITARVVGSLKSVRRNCHINNLWDYPPVAGSLRPLILGLP